MGWREHEEARSFEFNHHVWRDERGLWRDEHGRWRDEHGFWHDDGHPIHFFDRMLNHAIDRAADDLVDKAVGDPR